MSSSNIYTSPLCSCIHCREVKSAKGLHTHFERAHTNTTKYSSGNNGSYQKFKDKAAERKAVLESIYLESPNFCHNCNSALSFDKKQNKFCNHSCATKYTNIHNTRKHGHSKGFVPTCPTRPTRPKYTPVSCCVICNVWFRGKNKTCSRQCKSQLISKLARANPNCGGHRNSHRTKAVDSFGSICTLESSYEVRMASLLNELRVAWQRPSHFYYTASDGKHRRYHPDFFLPQYNIYLDPKTNI